MFCCDETRSSFVTFKGDPQLFPHYSESSKFFIQPPELVSTLRYSIAAMLKGFQWALNWSQHFGTV